MLQFGLSLGGQGKSLLNFGILSKVWNNVVNLVWLWSILWINILPCVSGNLFSELGVGKRVLDTLIKTEVWHEVINWMRLGIIWLPGEEWLSRGAELNIFFIIRTRFVIVGIPVNPNLCLDIVVEIWLWVPLVSAELFLSLSLVLSCGKDVLIETKVWYSIVLELLLLEILLSDNPLVVPGLLSPIEISERMSDVFILTEVWNKVVYWVWLWKILLGLDNPLVTESSLSTSEVSLGNSNVSVNSKVWDGVIFEWLWVELLLGDIPSVLESELRSSEIGFGLSNIFVYSKVWYEVVHIVSLRFG